MSIRASIGGEVLSPLSERAVEGFRGSDKHPFAVATDSASHWNEAHPGTGSRIGWELRSGGKVLKEKGRFAFRINPQDITRRVGSRTTMFATKRAFYVDDFGPGAETIQVQQLCATGGMQHGGAYVPLRASILAFYQLIYLRALGTGYKNPIEVFFYDTHLFEGTAAPGEKPTAPERVYFPSEPFTLERSVSLNNVWRCTITMVGLGKPGITKPRGSAKPGTVYIISDANEDLHHFTRRILAARGEKNPTGQRVRALEKTLRKLNPILNHGGHVSTYYKESGRLEKVDVKVSRMHIVKGEQLLLPA